MTAGVEQHLCGEAAARYRAFAPTSLRSLTVPSPAFCTLSDSFLDYLESRREAVLHWLTVGTRDASGRVRRDVLDYFAERTLRYFHQRNQFIVVGSEAADDLRDVYELFVHRFAEGVQAGRGRGHLAESLGDVMAQHQARLAAYVRDLQTSNGGGDFIFAEAVNAQYTPQLQLRLFGVEAEQLREPILDLGCGPDAPLTMYLRRLGKAVVGVDRTAQASEGTFKADWFDIALEAERWGAIVSHMAFSTHFLHHHLRADGHPERYARLYLDLLAALKPGGSLFYTPGLPFMENLLPTERYIVRRRPICLPDTSPLDAAFAHHLGTSVSYACRIAKR
ncbi:MAG: class I SAM-dependent methyltransferase [Deltaproteobacteria bacterium]|nr:class I SAM-dependent methyltransferase [Deltaproteobacteria bacterium]